MLYQCQHPRSRICGPASHCDTRWTLTDAQIMHSSIGQGSVDDVVQSGAALHSRCLTVSLQHHPMADGAQIPLSCQAGTDSMPFEAAPSNCTWLHQPQRGTYKGDNDK